MINRSEEEISQIVAYSLQMVLSGRSTMDAILLRYPDLVDVLRPEMEAALWLASKSSHYQPDPEFVVRSRKHLMERIRSEGRSARFSARRSGFSLNGQSWMWRLTALAAVFVFLFLSVIGTVYAAKDAVPGDNLYGVKRWTESTAYSLTADANRQAELDMIYAARRLDEAEQLLARGDSDLVPALIAEYEQQVDRSLAALNRAQEKEGPLNERLTGYMRSELARQSHKIDTMLTQVPSENVGILMQALETSKHGQEEVDEAVKKEKLPQSVKDTPGSVATLRSEQKSTGIPPDQRENPGIGDEMKATHQAQPEQRPEQAKTPGPDKTKEPKPDTPPAKNTPEGKDKNKDNAPSDKGNNPKP